MNIVTLCTGNVARSVMLGYMLSTLGDADDVDWKIRTAGTHVVEGSAMSGRTRDALVAIDELGTHPYGAHRSHQLDVDDVSWADVILASEADHVRFVRTNFADHAHKAVQLQQFVRRAPLDEPFETQLRVVASMEPNVELDIADPAGGDQHDYYACCEQLWGLAQAFAVLVVDRRID